MRLLITGASGFTGIHLARAATANGHQVVGLEADLEDAKAVAGEVAAFKPDAVIHLAGISDVAHKSASALYAVNVVGTCNLLDAVVRLSGGRRRVVLASSANVYGNASGAMANESNGVAPLSHYACSKVAMEQMSRTYLDRLDVVIARPFNYTGPGHDERFVIPKLVRAFVERAESVELGNIEVEREFNDVRFVVAAYLQLLAHGGVGETYNICTGVGHSLRSVMDELGRRLQHTPELQVNPAFIRPNEVFRLTGDPAKLLALGTSADGNGLTDLLRWMIAEYRR